MRFPDSVRCRLPLLDSSRLCLFPEASSVQQQGKSDPTAGVQRRVYHDDRIWDRDQYGHRDGSRGVGSSLGSLEEEKSELSIWVSLAALIPRARARATQITLTLTLANTEDFWL